MDDPPARSRGTDLARSIPSVAIATVGSELALRAVPFGPVDTFPGLRRAGLNTSGETTEEYWRLHALLHPDEIGVPGEPGRRDPLAQLRS